MGEVKALKVHPFFQRLGLLHGNARTTPASADVTQGDAKVGLFPRTKTHLVIGPHRQAVGAAAVFGRSRH